MCLFNLVDFSGDTIVVSHLAVKDGAACFSIVEGDIVV